jgi:Ion channel
MLVTFLSNAFLTGLAVLIHYEVLNLLSVMIPKLRLKHRSGILLGIFGALFAHIAEVWLYALGYYLKIQSGYFGSLVGDFDASLMDCAYFSFSTYTSLGYGDIQPTGNIRFLAALEALTGLVLIAWTSSFMFLEMQKLWKH